MSEEQVSVPYLIPEEIREEYTKWYHFMMDHVEFALKISPIHTKAHAGRVLLFALLIAQKRGLPLSDWNILGAASSFHDTRRHDDCLDVGHGARGAAYYHAYCRGLGLPYYRLAARIMQYHDHPDTLGNKIIGEGFGPHGVLLYHIFKDADALDRFRLGPGGFDPRYLRTPEGKGLYGYARDIWARVIQADPSLDRHWLEEKKRV
ncbi:hypothetical protein [Acidaminococcus timonensis]|jgi:hypothetical protein|uniref:hypothetical protein n=1 Tax=Acidaminococcus timonensis TaxID=1871002 RepID=UPI003A5BB905